MWLYFISQSKCKLQTILSVSSSDNGSDESIERNVVQALNKIFEFTFACLFFEK